MKKLKLLGIVFGLVAVLAMSVPAYAASVTTGVTILSGSGLAPMVKAKWETTSITDPQAESGDPSHQVGGTQVLPNIGFQATTNVTFWAVVTDPAGVGNIAHVYADVYYPGTGVADPGPNGSLKFEIELFRLTDPAATLVGYFNTASNMATPIVTTNNATPTFGNPPTQANDIVEELTQGSAAMYRGTFYFDNCELAGNYLVSIAASNGQNVKGYLSNTLNWLPLTAAEWDFTGVNYGNVAIGVHKQIDGNYLWETAPGTTPTPDPGDLGAGTPGATIRNNGNTYLKMTVKQDDMGLGQTNIAGVNVWNVHFDARLGADPAGYVNYDPSVVAGGNLAGASSSTLLQTLRLCALEKVDFSILVDKDSVQGNNHLYSGAMVLGAVIGTTPTSGTEYPLGTPAPTE